MFAAARCDARTRDSRGLQTTAAHPTQRVAAASSPPPCCNKHTGAAPRAQGVQACKPPRSWALPGPQQQPPLARCRAPLHPHWPLQQRPGAWCRPTPTPLSCSWTAPATASRCPCSRCRCVRAGSAAGCAWERLQGCHWRWLGMGDPAVGAPAPPFPAAPRPQARRVLQGLHHQPDLRPAHHLARGARVQPADRGRPVGAAVLRAVRHHLQQGQDDGGAGGAAVRAHPLGAGRDG